MKFTVEDCIRAIKREETRKSRLCLSQSEGDPNDENNLPVTCSREKGHKGKHAGGCMCGTIEWD